jgi:hypothetical protein
MIDPKIKTWIDNASYMSLLHKWRFAPAGDPFFQGETGEYYSKVMARRRDEVGPEEHTRVSKRVGWEN